MNKIVKAIIFLSFLNLLFFLYAYGVFFQTPFFKDQLLTGQQILEPVFYPSILLVGYYFVLTSVFSLKKVFLRFDEWKLFFPSVFLLIILGIGIGIHAAAQIIGHTLAADKQSFAYRLAYFLDEYPGHFLIFIPALILGYFLVLFELNRGRINLKTPEKRLLLICSLVNGMGMVVAGFEWGSQYLVAWPTLFFLILKIFKFKKFTGFDFWQRPFTFFYVVSGAVFIILTPVFAFIYGFTVQPGSGLGWQIRF